jgi:hypothetical protein
MRGRGCRLSTAAQRMLRPGAAVAERVVVAPCCLLRTCMVLQWIDVLVWDVMRMAASREVLLQQSAVLWLQLKSLCLRRDKRAGGGGVVW